MADRKAETGVETSVPATSPVVAPGEYIDRPAGWMYKGFKLGGRELWFASPKIQLLLVSMVCFLCPGMFNALGGLGGGGQVDPKAQDDANVALYSVFAVVGFFSGSLANKIGIKLTMSLGGLGYCIYAASFLSYSHNENYGFVIFAGAFLGLCAGLLWTGQGAIMMSYPPEGSKGRYISWFWIIFNLGAVIGSLIPLGENIHKTAGPVTDGTYVAFIVLMLVGAVLALFLIDAPKVQREDGTRPIAMKNPTWQSELLGLWETLYMEPWIVLLFPMFFASNIFYTYQQNDMNGAHFNVRTRALNNLLYWLAQIFGAMIFGYALDTKIRRTVRAKASFAALFVLTFVVWGGGYAYQKKFTASRSYYESDEYASLKSDWTAGGEKFIGPMFLYFFYGMFDAAWQSCIYWYMGALSNSSRKSANLAGFYKGIQSAGAVVFWRLDGLKTEYSTMFGASWGLLAGALLIAAPVICTKIKDTVTLEEDLKFSDETIEDVVAPEALHEKSTTV